MRKVLLISILVAGCASPHKSPDEIGRRPAAVTSPWGRFVEAVESRGLEEVSNLYKPSFQINAVAEDGKPVLGLAVDRGSLELVRFLLERGADPNITYFSPEDTNKEEPLDGPVLTAVRMANRPILEALLESGADINRVYVGRSVPVSPLSLAIDQKDRNLFNLLIERGANPNLLPPIITTELISALRASNRQMALELIAKGAKVEVVTQNEGESALMIAAQKGYLDVLKRILGAGVDVNTRSRNGETALMRAAQYGHLDVVQALINSGANVRQRNQNGQTAMDMVAYQNRQAILKSLRSALSRSAASTGKGE